MQNVGYLNEYIFQEVDPPYSYLQQILNLLLLILKLAWTQILRRVIKKPSATGRC